MQQTEKLEEAWKHYREAENVYRRIHDDLGLANVLQSMGDLEQRAKLFDQAIGFYEDAVNLYDKTMDKMGLSCTFVELCYCFAEKGNNEKTRIYVQHALELCENLPYENVKRYCKQKIEKALKRI